MFSVIAVGNKSSSGARILEAELDEAESNKLLANAAREVERVARQWVADHCPYQFYFRNVEYRFDEGVLTLRGRVPTFYLKQILQAVLVKLPQVARIDNRVEVVSSVGLSSAGGASAAPRY